MPNSGIEIKNRNNGEIIILRLKNGVNTIGRGENNDFILPLNAKMVTTTNHLKIELKEGQFWLIDNSRHGTKVGNQKLQSTSYPLKDGTCFEIDSYDYVFIFHKDIRKAGGTAKESSVLEKKLNNKYLFINEKTQKELDEKKEIIKSDRVILLTGETGSGKTFLAKYIHNLSRPRKKFIKVNLPYLNRTTLETELFGQKGKVYTGADKKVGLFKEADEGTIFLDEIGYIDETIQAKLLSVLGDDDGKQQIQPLGENSPISIDTRIITASNQPLKEKLSDALYSRITKFGEIKLPALRDIKEAIEPLINNFLKKYEEKYGEDFKLELSDDAIEMFEEYHWPYNVRELDSKIEYITLLYKDKSIVTSKDLEERDDLFQMKDQPEAKIQDFIPLKEYEKRLIEWALDQTGRQVNDDAVKFTGIPKATLYRKINKYGLRLKQQ